MLRINNCSYSYNLDNVLNSINLNIAKGCFFGLLGENGAGKTTLINLIVSVLKLQTGDIVIDGVSLQQNSNLLKQKLGWVPQEFNFNSFQTLENMLLINAGYHGILAKNAKKRMQYLLESLDLWHRKDMRIRQLSGGLKRRLMIARALLHQPKVLLLDEPTAGVDVTMRQATWDFLEHLNQTEQVTVVLTSHYLEEIEKLCHEVAVLHAGNIIQTGNLKQLLSGVANEITFIQLNQQIPDDLRLDNIHQYDKQHNILAVEINQAMDLTNVIELLLQHQLRINRIWSEQTRLANLLNKWTQT